MKLKRKTIIQYQGKVHDLCVANTHSYNIYNLGVHNSAAGSLVCYVLGITDIDPIKYDCRFDRFMSLARCLDPNTKVLTNEGIKSLKDIEIGNQLLTHDMTYKRCVNKFNAEHKKYAIVTVTGQKIKCSLNHKWLVLRNDKEVIVETQELNLSDEIKIQIHG